MKSKEPQTTNQQGLRLYVRPLPSRNEILPEPDSNNANININININTEMRMK